MKDRLNFAAIEFHRFCHWVNLAAWLFITLILIIQAHSAMNQYKRLPEKINTFKQIQEKYFKKTPNYEGYGRDGIIFLFVPSPVCIFTGNAIVPNDLNAKIDNIVTVQIYNSYKGKALDPGNWSGKPDIPGIISWLVTLFALWYGFRSFHSPEYAMFLSGLRSRLSVFTGILLPRLLLFLAAFTGSMIIIYLYVRAHGIVFSHTEIMTLWGILISALPMITSFFIIGVIISAMGQRPGSYIALLAAWALLTFGISWGINANVEAKLPDTTREYKTALDKFRILIDYEDKCEEKYGKYNPDRMDIERKLVEQYKKENFPKINNVETLSKEMIEGIIKGYIDTCSWYPTGFFRISAHEGGSRGFINFLAFYDYAQDMYRLFVRFIIDRSFYHDTKELVSFIRGDESVFKGKSVLPDNYLRALTFNLGYCILLLFPAYLAFKRMLFPGTKKIAAFSPIRLDLQSNGIISLTCRHAGFLRQIYNGLSGKAVRLGWKVTMDGMSLLTGKPHDFLYLPNPSRFPGELKGLHVLNLFKRLLPLSPGEAVEIKKRLGKKLLNKRLSRMEPVDKARLFISLAARCGKSLHIYDDLPLGIEQEGLKEIREIMEAELKPGTTVIDWVSSFTLWLNYRQRIYIGFRDGAYFSVPKPGEDS